jgi:hypothetical protein
MTDIDLLVHYLTSHSMDDEPSILFFSEICLGHSCGSKGKGGVKGNHPATNHHPWHWADLSRTSFENFDAIIGHDQVELPWITGVTLGRSCYTLRKGWKAGKELEQPGTQVGTPREGVEQL